MNTDCPSIPAEFEKDRISVIIPTYNYGHFVSSAIDSVLQQGLPNCEIIVIDDGSTDDTAQRLTRYRARITYMRQENQGLSAARNTGLAASTGEFLLFLDADDLLARNSLAGRLSWLKAHADIDATVCRTYTFSRAPFGGHAIPSGYWPLYRDHLPIHLCFFNIAPPHAFLLRRRFVAAAGAFDTSLRACEDYDYWLKAAFAGQKFAASPLGRVYYRRHAASMSADLARQFRHDAILHRRLWNRLESNAGFLRDLRLEALLAVVAGIGVTLKRLYEIGEPHLAGELWAIYCEAGNKIDELLRDGSPTWTMLARLYWLRICSVYPSIVSRCGAGRSLFESFLTVPARLGAPAEHRRLTMDLLLAALLCKEPDPLVRYRVVTLTLAVARAALGRTVQA